MFLTNPSSVHVRNNRGRGSRAKLNEVNFGKLEFSISVIVPLLFQASVPQCFDQNSLHLISLTSSVGIVYAVNVFVAPEGLQDSAQGFNPHKR
jgi:hypothetical protein